MQEKLKIIGVVTKVESEKMTNLRALASITIGGIKIDNIRVVEREGNLFVDFPQHKGTNKEGETIYRGIVNFGRTGEEEKGKKIKNVIQNLIVKGLESIKDESRTVKIEKETDFDYDRDYVGAYINPVTSNKIMGAGSIYYGGILSINPVFIKEIENKETHEKSIVINLESRQDKEGNFKEVVYPIEKGLRTKMIESSIKSLEENQNIVNKNENEDFSIEDTEFYKELEDNKDEKNIEEEL